MEEKKEQIYDANVKAIDDLVKNGNYITAEHTIKKYGLDLPQAYAHMAVQVAKEYDLLKGNTESEYTNTKEVLSLIMNSYLNKAKDYLNDNKSPDDDGDKKPTGNGPNAAA